MLLKRNTLQNSLQFILTKPKPTANFVLKHIKRNITTLTDKQTPKETLYRETTTPSATTSTLI
jgi:hypothetical protein